MNQKLHFTHGSLFTGIGGFDYASELLGWKNIFQVEKDKWCLTNLQKNFPDTERYTDIIKFDGSKYKNKITVLSGGFPCQPFSNSGKRNGSIDERHLWPSMLRVIREIEPIYIVAENVPGLLDTENGMVFKQIHTDLENSGYEVQTFDIPAAGKNANHKRNRVWIIANSQDITTKHTLHAGQQKHSVLFSNYYNTSPSVDGTHLSKKNTGQKSKFGNDTEQSNFSNAGSIYGHELAKESQKSAWKEFRSVIEKWNHHWSTWAIEPTLPRNNHGVSHRVDRIRALGNAVVPQVVLEIFRSIEASHNQFICSIT